MIFIDKCTSLQLQSIVYTPKMCKCIDLYEQTGSTFTTEKLQMTQKTRVFVRGKNFRPSLNFVGKAKHLP